MKAFLASLSGRLLFMTVCFVMLAELLIFLPSVAKFRLDYLQHRLEMGELAGLAQRVANPENLTPSHLAQLHEKAGVLAVALHAPGRRVLAMEPGEGVVVAETFDLREAGAPGLIWDAIKAALRGEPRVVRVLGESRTAPGDLIDVTIDETRLRRAMLDFGVRIFWLSLVISAITATLVYLSLNRALVRPMSAIIASIVSFREDPEDAERIIRPSGATGELAVAERELAETQAEVRAALQQKTRLAALGEAVAKISHDLRNILASAQLMADRLEGSADPMVARVGPKLIGSLDRAIRLCAETLAYGRYREAPPAPKPLTLGMMADDLRAALGLGDEDDHALRLRFELRAPADFIVAADADQLFRALHNLARNAAQAIEAHKGGVGVIALEARMTTAANGAPMVEIDLVDDGPGLPKEARKDLFKPFKGSGSKGGSGLGVAIAAELARGHGGALDLVDSGEAGTRFRITLPQSVARAAA